MLSGGELVGGFLIEYVQYCPTQAFALFSTSSVTNVWLTHTSLMNRTSSFWIHTEICSGVIARTFFHSKYLQDSATRLLMSICGGGWEQLGFSQLFSSLENTTIKKGILSHRKNWNLSMSLYQQYVTIDGSMVSAAHMLYEQYRFTMYVSDTFAQNSHTQALLGFLTSTCIASALLHTARMNATWSFSLHIVTRAGSTASGIVQFW